MWIDRTWRSWVQSSQRDLWGCSFPLVESFHCTMGWHQSADTIICPGACSICFSLFTCSHLPKKKQEFSTTHFSSLSKQLNYSDKKSLIWKCLNKWISGLLTSLRRTANLLREFPIMLLTVLVSFFYFRGIWYNTAQLLGLHAHSFFWNQRLCLRCKPSTSSEFKSNLCAPKENIQIKEADRNDKKVKWQAQTSTKINRTAYDYECATLKHEVNLILCRWLLTP